MDYIIFDLEFNQHYKKEDTSKPPLAFEKCPFEIIQIGALKVDSDFNEIASFNTLIKPTIYMEMHPFVEKLTNITMDMLLEAETFDKVFDDFLKFVKDKDNIFCVWGLNDLREIYRNINYHQLDMNALSKKYINIQYYASKYLETPGGKNIGLQNALDLLHIPLNRQLHDAYNDAYYTTKVMKKLYNESIQPKIYDPSHIGSQNNSRENKPKKQIDYKGLIQQFEKMHERKMSEEEISMINLSYKMGMTHQFQKDIEDIENN